MKLLLILAEPTSLGMLGDPELSLELANLTSAELRGVDGRFHVAGTVRAMATVTANKKHVHTETCHKRVGGFEVPYPCVKTSESRETIAHLSMEADLDLVASIRSNAPGALSGLELSIGATCGTMNIRGLQNDVERLLRPFVCRAIESKLSFAVKLESLIHGAAQFGDLWVERLEARSVGDLFILDVAFRPPTKL